MNESVKFVSIYCICIKSDQVSMTWLEFLWKGKEKRPSSGPLTNHSLPVHFQKGSAIYSGLTIAWQRKFALIAAIYLKIQQDGELKGIWTYLYQVTSTFSIQNVVYKPLAIPWVMILHLTFQRFQLVTFCKNKFYFLSSICLIIKNLVCQQIVFD